VNRKREAVIVLDRLDRYECMDTVKAESLLEVFILFTDSPTHRFTVFFT